MPRLPDKTALGGAPSMRSARPMADFPGVKAPMGLANEGEEAIGAGVQKLGLAVTGIAEEQRKEEDALDLAKADASAQKQLIESRRRFESDPDWKTFGPRFDEEASGILKGAADTIRNPLLREKWVEGKGILEVARTKDQVIRHGDALGRQDKFDETEGILKTRRDAYIQAKDDAERGVILRSAEDDIALGLASGYLRPQDARKLRAVHIDGMKVDDGEARLARSWNDPNEALGLIRDLTGGSETGKIPSAGKASESGLDFLRGKEGFRPKAYRDGFYPDGSPRWSIGYGTPADGPDATITRGEADKRMTARTAEIDDWITKNITAKLTQGQHDALVSFGYNLGRTNLEKIKDDINAGDVARVSERMKAFSKRRDAESGDLIEDAGLAARRADEADLFAGGNSPGARYAGLDFRRRHALLTHAREALSTTLQQDAKDAATLLERGIEPERDAQGRTAFDRLRMVLKPNQIVRYNLVENEARTKGRAVFGDPSQGVPALGDLSEEDAAKRIGGIVSDKMPDASLQSAVKVQANVERVWGKIADQRKRDPAQAVSGMLITGPAGPRVGVSPDGQLILREDGGEDGAQYKFGPAREVKNALTLISKRVPEAALSVGEDGSVSFQLQPGAPAVKGQEAWATLFEARRAAQTRVGIADYDQRIITKREAHDLLQIPADPSKLTERQYVAALKAAADRAEQTFGPRYGGKVFEDALALQIRGKPHDDAATGILASLMRKTVRGEKVSQDDVRRMSALSELDRNARDFLGEGVYGHMSPSLYMGDRPALADRPAVQEWFTPYLQRNLRQSGGLPAERNTPPPTPEDVDWALRDPQRQEQFDQRYGAGAFAREIGKRNKDTK